MVGIPWLGYRHTVETLTSQGSGKYWRSEAVTPSGHLYIVDISCPMNHCLHQKRFGCVMKDDHSMRMKMEGSAGCLPPFLLAQCLMKQPSFEMLTGSCA